MLFLSAVKMKYLVTIFSFFLILPSQNSAEIQTSLYFNELKRGGPLPIYAVLSTHTVYSETECSLKCLEEYLCVGFNYKSARLDEDNFQVSSEGIERLESTRQGNNTWIFFQILTTGKEQDCSVLYRSGIRRNGVYEIDPDGKGSFKVFCDMTTSGSGWTVFQRQLDGSVDFYRGWQDYKNGFGNFAGEYWLGLDKIHRLTADSRNEIRIDLEDTFENTKYAEYDSFAVSSEHKKFIINLGVYSGTAGDSFSFQNGMAFSTKDSDNDRWGFKCAETFKSGWWHYNCHKSNLNGLYHYMVSIVC